MSYLGRQPTIGNFLKLDAITTSATTTFNLLNGGVAYSPQSANHCIVSLNGVIQSPNTSFTISGSTIVFASALTSSDVIDFILVLGDVLNIGTPSDATVTFPKVTSNLITGATAETSIAGGDQILIYDDSATALRKMTRTNFVAGIGGTNTPAFQAYLNTSQSVSNTTLTKINFETEDFDTNSCYNNSSTYRFTPTTSGKYYIYSAIRSATTNNTIYIYKNGSNVKQSNLVYSGDGSNFVYTIESANGSSDYFEIFFYHSYGSTRDLNGDGGGGQRYCTFGAFKIIE